MEKLLELLNEYRTEKGERNLNEFEVSQTLDSLNYLRLFIDWLVDNDKIDLLKRTFMNLRYAEEIIAGHFSLEEKIIIILAISENPISDLISVLK